MYDLGKTKPKGCVPPFHALVHPTGVYSFGKCKFVRLGWVAVFRFSIFSPAPFQASIIEKLAIILALLLS